MKNETKRIDDCECVYCGEIFDGHTACNGDMDTSVLICPKCGKEMYVYLSIEYMCRPIESI